MTSVEVSFGRVSAPVLGTVTYVGVVPGTVGLYQINVVLPDIALPPGLTWDDYVNVSVNVNGTPVRQDLSMPFSK